MRPLLATQRSKLSVLDVRATCRVRGLSLASLIGPCVVHRRGHLHVEGCVLACDAAGLDHLCSPLVTLAISPPSQSSAGGALGSGPVAAAGAQVAVSRVGLAAEGGPSAAAGRGKLLVVSSRLEGGTRAVRTEGSGALQGVRVVQLAHGATLYFFTVGTPACDFGHPITGRSMGGGRDVAVCHW